MEKGQKSWEILKKGHEIRKQTISAFFSFKHGKHQKKLENEEKESQK
jgi:hypothetical protein